MKAVLFDMDGVLYDSMPFHVRAWEEACAARCLRYGKYDFYLFEGRTGESTIDLLFMRTFGRHATEEEISSIYADKSRRFAANNNVHIMPGAPEALQQARARGLQLLVVTGSGQHSLIDQLNDDFPGCFTREKIVTAFDVTRGKPHPEPYLMGLAKAGAKPCEAIVVENAPLGIRAAVAAGIFTIAVNTGPLPDSVLLDEGANILLPNMQAVARYFAGNSLLKKTVTCSK